jgi:hypothetical protein
MPVAGQTTVEQHPTHDLVDRVVPADVFAQHQHRAVGRHRRCRVHGTRAGEQALAHPAPPRATRRARAAGSAPCRAAATVRRTRSSIASLPHHPQLDVVLPSRGVGTGARPPVSTVTTLNSLSLAAPSAQ